MTSRPLDAKAEQSQRVQQILAQPTSKQQPEKKKPKNLEHKIRAVKAIAEGFSEADIEALLKESRYDETVVINNILDGITPRPGDSWSVVHNKMTKEERDAKKQTVVVQQPAKSFRGGRGGRGGRGDSEGGRGRGGSRGGEGRGGKRDAKEGKPASATGGRGGRGGRTHTAENGQAQHSAERPASATGTVTAPAPVPAPAPAPAPVTPPAPAIIPSGIITSTPNNPAPTIAQIVAGTATVGGRPAQQPTPSEPARTSVGAKQAQPVAHTQPQVHQAKSPAPSTLPTAQTTPSPAPTQAPGQGLLPNPIEASAAQPMAQQKPAQPQLVQPQPVQQQTPSQPPAQVQQAQPQTQPQAQPQAPVQQQKSPQPQSQQPQQGQAYGRQAGFQGNSKTPSRQPQQQQQQQQQQWKPKPSKETGHHQQFAGPAGAANLHSAHLGPVVLPGEFPSDIDDNSLNFQFGNFQLDGGKSLESEPTTVEHSLQVQPTQPQSQPQPAQPQPQQQAPVQPQQPQQQTQAPSHQHAAPTTQHSHSHHPAHAQHQQAGKPQHEQQKTGYQGKQHHHQPAAHHHQLQQPQTHVAGGAVLNQDPQEAHQLHAMHHLAGMDEMSQMYWQPPVMPFPISPFPHYETDTGAYYDTYQQPSAYHRQQGAGASDVKGYPTSVGNAALSSNYRGDGKFNGQEGAPSQQAGNTSGQQGVAAGAPGSPQPGQPHAAFPLQGSFPTMYPYPFMGHQFPSFQPATSPQYPYRVPLFKTSPPYNYNAGLNTPGYPASTPGASGYPEELNNTQDFKNMYMQPPYYAVGGLQQPDAFVLKQAGGVSGIPPSSASSSASGAGKSQQGQNFPGVVNGNQDLASGAGGAGSKGGQQDYSKFPSGAGREASNAPSLYSPYYPNAPRPSY